MFTWLITFFLSIVRSSAALTIANRIETSAMDALVTPSSEAPETDLLENFQSYLTQTIQTLEENENNWNAKKIEIEGAASAMVTDASVNAPVQLKNKEHSLGVRIAISSALASFRDSVALFLQSPSTMIETRTAETTQHIETLEHEIVALDKSLQALADQASLEALQIKSHICDHSVLLLSEMRKMLVEVQNDIQFCLKRHNYTVTAERTFIALLLNHFLLIPVPTITLIDDSGFHNTLNTDIEDMGIKIKSRTADIEGVLLSLYTRTQSATAISVPDASVNGNANGSDVAPALSASAQSEDVASAALPVNDAEIAGEMAADRAPVNNAIVAPLIEKQAQTSMTGLFSKPAPSEVPTFEPSGLLRKSNG